MVTRFSASEARLKAENVQKTLEVQRKKDDEQKVTLLLDFCAEVLSIDDLDLSQKFVTALAETYTIKQEDAPQFFNQSGYEAVGMYRFVKQI